MKTANESLSILLLVRNAQGRLAREVERLVETASELTRQFDVVIIDDGSTDATEEIAWELSARHSQVELIRQPRQLGPIAALRAGLAHTTGQYVLVSDGSGVAADEALSALWRQRHTKRDSQGLAWQRPVGAGWLEKLLRPLRNRAGSTDQTLYSNGWRLVRRAELTDLAPLAATSGRSYLDRPRAPHAPMTGSTADRANTSWHNAIS